MKLNIEFLQTGGVPLTNDLMAQIMEAIKLYDAVGSLAGHMTIIAGCELVAGSTNTVLPGVVAINHEVLYFEGGIITTNVYVYEQEISKTFQNQQSKILIKKRSVKFGNSTAPNLFAWADFVKLQTLKSLQESLAGKVNQSDFDVVKADVERLKLKTAPIENGGVVFIFRRPASEIPVGWKECEDLRRKTIFGYDPTGGGVWADLTHAGGSETVTLAKENLPAVKLKTGILQPYGGNNGNGGFDGGSNQWNWKQLETETLGTSAPLNVLNPHRLVNFIEPNFQ